MKKILKKLVFITLIMCFALVSIVCIKSALIKEFSFQGETHSSVQEKKTELLPIGELHTAKLKVENTVNYGDCLQIPGFETQLKITENDVQLEYSITLEAGYEVSEIKQSQKDGYVLVKLPEAKIYDSSFDEDNTHTVRKDGFLNKISGEDFDTVRKLAEEDALSTGKDKLLEMAESSAKEQITKLYKDAGIDVRFE